MLIFENVTKQFFDDAGVKDVSFVVEPGEFVFITGESGSGKTTLMRLLTREYTPTTGSIQFEDQHIHTMRDRHVPYHRRNIGVVFQDYKLIPQLNVWENIALALQIIGKPQSEIEQRVTDLLNLVDLVPKALMFPAQLSGGEAQRVSIARALSVAPSLIFADEPTGNLDLAGSLRIADLLHKINQLGTTVLFATHDVSVLDKYPKARKIVLKAGELHEDSHPKQKPTPKPEEKKDKDKKEEKETKDNEEKKDTKNTDHDKDKSKSKESSPNDTKATKEDNSKSKEKNDSKKDSDKKDAKDTDKDTK